ncbi:MAG: cytochrome c oxidase assembly protein [Pseudomonadota bacterium]|nr:cytochrome c oxidase assembly protein [Pseudomonadota bacterium]
MTAQPGTSDAVLRRNSRTLKWALVATLASFGFGFALVPLYDVLCEKILGIKPVQAAAVAPVCTGVEHSRVVTVEFDTSIHADLPWQLDSQKKTLKVHPCELNEVVFTATNRGALGMSGQAIFGVAPSKASANLTKTECFCFTEQHLNAGESRAMPVRFMLDDQLPKDVNTITFRYVFNPVRVDPIKGTSRNPLRDPIAALRGARNPHVPAYTAVPALRAPCTRTAQAVSKGSQKIVAATRPAASPHQI